MYVLSKNTATNELVVGTQEEAMVSCFKVEKIHWHNAAVVPDAFDCLVRIRHLGELHQAHVQKEQDVWSVVLTAPIFGVASGQSAVFYADTVVMGGGIIL
jgi:tRNA-specific 2-thiouridylase